jgi:hypothetical protein
VITWQQKKSSADESPANRALTPRACQACIALTIALAASLRANIEAMCIASHPDGFELFLGNMDGEVYASGDGGEHWRCIANGLGAISKLGHFRLVTAEAADA